MLLRHGIVMVTKVVRVKEGPLAAISYSTPWGEYDPCLPSVATFMRVADMKG
jgi:hypothetical protein